MKKQFSFLAFLFALSCAHAPAPLPVPMTEAKVPVIPDKISAVAEEWLRCPPPNPRRPQLCAKACCGDGSNWFLSCITFVGEVTREAKGVVDAELLRGYSANPPYEFGSAVKAWKAMQAAGRARTDFAGIEPGSAVFFDIPGFPPGHIAIYAGEKDSAGNPLLITTGGKANKRLRKESMVQTAREWRAKILGWVKL